VKLIKINPSKIKIPEVRVTSVMTEEKEQLLREFLAKSGVIAPVVVQEIEGELYLVDGKHRVDELIAAGDKPLEAAVIEGDMVDLLTRNLFLDHVRGEHRVGDMIQVFKELTEVHGLDTIQISERTGLSQSYVEKIVKISTASPPVLEALNLGLIGVGHAAEIARLPSMLQQEEIVAKQQVFRFPVKDLKVFVDDVLKAMSELPPEPEEETPAAEPAPRVYLCEGCKQPAESRYLRPLLVCPTCFGAVWKLGKAAEIAKESGDEE